MKHFRAAAHEQADSFSRKQVFLKLTIFFSLRSKSIPTKVITFSKGTTLFLILLTSAAI